MNSILFYTYYGYRDRINLNKMDKNLEETKAVSPNLDYALSVINKSKNNKIKSIENLNNCVNIQIGFSANSNPKYAHELNSNNDQAIYRIRSNEARRTENNRAINNIHNFSEKFNQNNPMNIILTSNNNQIDRQDNDSDGEVQSKNENNSCSTNDSFLDNEGVEGSNQPDVEGEMNSNHRQDRNNSPVWDYSSSNVNLQAPGDPKDIEESKYDEIPREEFERYK